MKMFFVVFVFAGFWCSSALSDHTCGPLVDQYMADPTLSPNGYSNHDGSAGFGPRYILDDFDTSGEPWKITCFSFRHAWNTLTVPSGTGVTIGIWGDNNGMPDPNNVMQLNVTDYEETALGSQAFGREIMESMIRFDQIRLEGRFWFHATINGPENNFMLVNDNVQGSELWIDYHDLNGLQPGSELFGVKADAQYILYGPPLTPPEPSALQSVALFAVVLLVWRKRRSTECIDL